MGIHIDDLTALGRGFHKRLSELDSGTISDIALQLHIDESNVDMEDFYQSIRQAIYDDLQKEGELPGDRRQRIAFAFREWIHTTPLSQCNMGCDTCPDWPLAYELADIAMERKV